MYDVPDLRHVTSRSPTCSRFRNSKVSISKPKAASMSSSTRSAYLAASTIACMSCHEAPARFFVAAGLGHAMKQGTSTRPAFAVRRRCRRCCPSRQKQEAALAQTGCNCSSVQTGSGTVLLAVSTPSRAPTLAAAREPSHLWALHEGEAAALPRHDGHRPPHLAQALVRVVLHQRLRGDTRQCRLRVRTGRSTAQVSDDRLWCVWCFTSACGAMAMPSRECWAATASRDVLIKCPHFDRAGVHGARRISCP